MGINPLNWMCTISKAQGLPLPCIMLTRFVSLLVFQLLLYFILVPTRSYFCAIS